jgi:hypothetical protein
MQGYAPPGHDRLGLKEPSLDVSKRALYVILERQWVLTSSGCSERYGQAECPFPDLRGQPIAADVKTLGRQKEEKTYGT